jgi:hypothetical protein
VCLHKGAPNFDFKLHAGKVINLINIEFLRSQLGSGVARVSLNLF